MAMQPAIRKGANALAVTRSRVNYNAAEQQFALVLQQRLADPLQGRRSSLLLVRCYPKEPGRLGAMATPRGLVRAELRLPDVEMLVRDTINFLRLKEAGGPVSQEVLNDGSIVEHQIFPTKFPHIVLNRTDRYESDDEEPVEVMWSIERLQNQRAQTQINLLLDAAGLLAELVRFAG